MAIKRITLFISLLLVTSIAFAGAEPEMVPIPGKDFEIGKYDVTQAEWVELMNNNPSEHKDCGDNCPVEHVSWNDVQEYIKKLNLKTGKQYRLPTETEWKYACNAGKQTKYCGGDNIDSIAWYGNAGQAGGNSGQTLHPVGQKKANGYGLYDMDGNVWQWMANCDQNDCALRAVCGGSWANLPQTTCASTRSKDESTFRNGVIGFRLARTLP